MLRTILLFAFLLVVLGCGSTDGRLRITGEVTYDGGPLEEGYLTLNPLGDGPSAGAPIQNGTFTIDANKGPKSGKYRVSIEARRKTGRMIPIDPNIPEDTVPETEQYLPPQYNSRSEIEVDISPENTHYKWELRS